MPKNGVLRRVMFACFALCTVRVCLDPRKKLVAENFLFTVTPPSNASRIPATVASVAVVSVVGVVG